MSILAMICVYECDACKRTAIVKNQSESVAFEATWYDGLFFSFCPSCREKPEIIVAIAQEKERMKGVAALRAKREKEAGEYVH